MAKLRYDEKHLTDFDIFWLRNDSPENQMNINFVFCMEKDVKLSVMNDYLARWSANYPRFRSQAVHKGGMRYDWVQYPDFDPAKYGCVGEHRLKEPTQECLTEFINEKANEPLGRGEFKCMWKMYRVENVPWGGCLILWRIHHCVCDGMAVVEVCRSIFEDDKDVPDVAAPTRPRRRRRGIQWTKWGKMVCPMMIGVGIGYGVLGLAALSSVAVGVALMVTVCWGKPLLRTMLMISGLNYDSKSPLRNALSGKKTTAVVGGMITVASARALAEQVSTEKRHYTINDVLIAMVGGAFRRYYKSIGINPDKMALGCVVPVNIRHPKEQVKCENRFTLVFAKIPVHIEKAIDRVKFMHDKMEDLKNGFDPLAGVFLIKSLNFMPQFMMDRLVRFFCRNASMVVTNVNSRDKPVRFAGSLLKDAYGWVPSAGGIGVGVSLISYMGKLNVGLIADRAQVPNIGALADCFRDEWHAMHAELPNLKKPKSA